MPLIDPALVPEEVPVLGIHGTVLFPEGSLPLALLSDEAVAAVLASEQTGGLVAVALRRAQPRDDEPYHRVATLALVRDLLGTSQVRCHVQGLARVELSEVRGHATHRSARLRLLAEASGDAVASATRPRDRRLRERLAADGPDAFPDLSLAAVRALIRTPDRSQLADLVLANLPISADEKQRGLAERNVDNRLALASALLDRAVADVAAGRGLADEVVRVIRLVAWRAWRLGALT
jgi:ATP-dependent Lon protease